MGVLRCRIVSLRLVLVVVLRFLRFVLRWRVGSRSGCRDWVGGSADFDFD